MSTIFNPVTKANLITSGFLDGDRLGMTPHTIVTLLSGNDDETSSSASNCTVGTDTTNFKVGDRGILLTMSGAVTATATYDPISPLDPVVIPPAQAIGAWFYVPDSTKVSSIVLDIYSDSGATTRWTRSSADITALTTGWNFYRWMAVAGTLTGWGTIYRIRITVVTSAATTVTIGHVWAECARKARILFIEDGGYLQFMNNGYLDLKARGIPVTWSIDPNLLGSSSGTSDERISIANVATVAADGNNNSIGFHGWDGTVTSSMTAAQIRADTMKAIKWLKAHGYYIGALWRSAWVQNAATNASAAQPLVLAYATPGSTASLSCWPPQSRWNIPRLALQGLSQANMDTHFTNLQTTYGLMVIYTHYVDAGGGNNTTPANWAYFLSKIDAGLSAGWLEGVTFEQLFTRSGGRIRQSFGDTLVEWFDENGTRTQTRLP